MKSLNVRRLSPLTFDGHRLIRMNSMSKFSNQIFNATRGVTPSSSALVDALECEQLTLGGKGSGQHEGVYELILANGAELEHWDVYNKLSFTVSHSCLPKVQPIASSSALPRGLTRGISPMGRRRRRQ